MCVRQDDIHLVHYHADRGQYTGKSLLKHPNETLADDFVRFRRVIFCYTYKMSPIIVVRW